MRENARAFYFKKLDKYEGGYSNNPDDPGGETYRGITVKNHPELAEKIRNQTLTDDEVLEIFIKEYWVPAKCDEIPTGLDVCVADASFNCGPQRAVKILQMTLNAVRGTHLPSYAKLVIDGKFGPNTRKAITDIEVNIDNFDGVFEAIWFYNHYRMKFNSGLVKSKRWTPHIFWGVSNRISDLVEYALKLHLKS